MSGRCKHPRYITHNLSYINASNPMIWTNVWRTYKSHFIWWLKSSPRNASYMRQWTESPLVRVMVCRLFWRQAITLTSSGLLPIGLIGKNSVKFESQFYHSRSRKCILNCRLPKWRPFCPGEMSSWNGNAICITALLLFSGGFLWVAIYLDMMASSNWNTTRVTGLLCGYLTGHQWIPLTKDHWCGVLMFSFIYAWTNGWMNNRDAGDLRRHCGHYDVTAMFILMKNKNIPIYTVFTVL